MYELTDYEVEFVSGDGKVSAVGTAVGGAGGSLVAITGGSSHIANIFGGVLIGIGAGMVAFDQWTSS